MPGSTEPHLDRTDHPDGSKIRVAIVDDHPIARQGLAKILEGAGNIELVASCARPGELGTAGWEHTPPAIDVMLLDLYLDGHVMALDAITSMSTHVPILVISASRHPGDVVAAVRAGASGYVSKHASETAYATAIRAVAAGQFHLSAQLADMLQAEVAPARPVLSPREQETLSYIARGFTHAQTATRMHVSKATVETFIARIRAKLGLGNKAELALAALTHLDVSSYPPGTHNSK
ncbi:response regulator transcription factor [Actinocrispum sp. NPDC049592]|uniref:response regulator transcription factor n=1 Tax=Actinocrispum sp. NPDC049592 TaxID=3154835 RepID=UPI0034224251